MRAACLGVVPEVIFKRVDARGPLGGGSRWGVPIAMQMVPLRSPHTIFTVDTMLKGMTLRDSCDCLLAMIELTVDHVLGAF